MLTEHPVPDDFKCCKACSVSEHGGRMIWGEGTPHAPMMFVLDNPGAREDKFGDVFMCGTRQTLSKAMELSSIAESEVYVTWILKCRPTKKYEKTLSRKRCLKHLEYQILNYKPEIIVCLGNVSVQSLWNDSADVKELRGKCMGYGEDSRIALIATYHPLAARRRPNLMPLLVADLAFAKEILDQRLSYIDSR